MTLNQRFNLEYWCNTFPASEIDRRHAENPRKDTENKYNRWIVGCPESVARTVHSRSAIWPDLNPASGVPTDFFAWALGKSESRAATKIGGMPYLPRSIAWPTTENGVPLAFLAQLNLSDSHDHLPDLPGNMLLIFCEAFDARLGDVRILRGRGETVADPVLADEPIEYRLSYDFKFLFVDMTQYGPDSLLQRDDAPDAPFYLRPLHGQRVRSSDHPDLDVAYKEEMMKDAPRFYGVYPPGCWWATKVGGVPTWEQGQCSKPWGDDLNRPDAPQFIGQLSSDRSNLGSPFPYVGREEPYASSWDERIYRLTIADAGMLYLFWDGENVIYDVQGG